MYRAPAPMRDGSDTGAPSRCDGDAERGLEESGDTAAPLSAASCTWTRTTETDGGNGGGASDAVCTVVTESSGCSASTSSATDAAAGTDSSSVRSAADIARAR